MIIKDKSVIEKAAHPVYAMGFFNGLTYNLQGLWLGIRTPKLLALGLLRFAVVILITITLAGFILIYHNEILSLIWTKPESHWILWLWHTLSWFISLCLVALTAVVSYLISQVLFAVVIMDYMSRITERMITGHENIEDNVPVFKQFSYLIKQEVPRTILPILLSLLLLILGWLTPLGPVLSVVSSMVAVVFLAWDNTDLIPARRLKPFKERFRLLIRSLPFHLGFGLLFLVPGANILFLCFAPVGGTLYYIKKYDHKEVLQTPNKSRIRADDLP